MLVAQSRGLRKGYDLAISHLFFHRLFHKSHRFALYLGIISKISEPVDLRFAPEPGHLPLGVVAVGLLRRRQGLLTVYFTAKELHGLLISQGGQRCSGLAVLCVQAASLFD